MKPEDVAPEPLAIVKPGPVVVMCEECGTMVTVHDVRSLILGLHLVNNCDLSDLISRNAE
jgi:hypothetical protein